MRGKMDDGVTVSIASTIQKTLRSRDSAERMVRAIVDLWRKRAGEHDKPAALILDFNEISLLSESVADVLVQFRFDFPGGKCPRVEFLNVSAPVRKVLIAAEQSREQLRKKASANRKKKSGFTIEI